MMEFHGLERLFPAGDWSPRLYREAEEKVKALPLSDSLRFVFFLLFRELREVRAMKLETLRHMRALGRSEKYCKAVKLLQSAPGIGPLTAIRLALEWGDVGRFKRKENFAAFLGLIPSDYSTGEQDHKGHITKQGSRHVRWWLIESAWVAIRHDPVLLEKYQTVVSHSGSSKKAIVAVARKLAIRLWAILLSGEPYQKGLIEFQKA
jgi:transposase